ncbi:hypothetical protein Ssi03_57780 [Sphaerisporangium siamense]|uniref:Putative Rossmann fold nucleotide-binding protein DprA/Smf involved in DNA uptake n=1 Tax=Sphaerisporangium siamense TaxID=795645 RepID=A0A7W7D6P9_9ACTN|nr:DNA-processing protein DprA [Sphaerisporangium siamense]MBB4700370.1 putative Rossmann fold nucleotide-binding protein DprA/Smf involved in DNA uptake [Sphaerisporangium siamense]GII87788.1 hypothetical protein Ssi03_57780 [Sphaerisporangium siamense]
MTFDDTAVPLMAGTLTITGARSTGHRPIEDYWRLFVDYLGPFARPTVDIYLGGASGIDSIALLWLATETDTALHVVVPGTVQSQPSDARHAIQETRALGRLVEVVELKHPTHPSPASYHQRNRWMVDHSEFVIGFPRGSDPSSGTWYTLEYAAQQSRTRLIIPI